MCYLLDRPEASCPSTPVRKKNAEGEDTVQSRRSSKKDVEECTRKNAAEVTRTSAPGVPSDCNLSWL
jgi:hypothetical protein